GLAALDVRHEPDAARVMLLLGVVEAGLAPNHSLRLVRTGTLFHFCFSPWRTDRLNGARANGFQSRAARQFPGPFPIRNASHRTDRTPWLLVAAADDLLSHRREV